jgi:hypothetical protein
MTLNAFKPAPCKFCGREVSYEPLKEMEEYGVKVYFCHPCLAEYVYWNDGAHATASVYITYRDRMYRWTVSNDMGQLWYIKNPGVPGTRRNENLELIKTFRRDIPHINPSNFLEKLSIYLVFL